MPRVGTDCVGRRIERVVNRPWYGRAAQKRERARGREEHFSQVRQLLRTVVRLDRDALVRTP
jgi:hypothetical protein